MLRATAAVATIAMRLAGRDERPAFHQRLRGRDGILTSRSTDGSAFQIQRRSLTSGTLLRVFLQRFRHDAFDSGGASGTGLSMATARSGEWLRLTSLLVLPSNVERPVRNS